jgi:hypothetical protein
VSWSSLPNSVQEFNEGLINKDEIVRTMQFHSHLFDMSKQDASTTHAHMICLLNKLCEGGEERQQFSNSTLMDAASSIAAVRHYTFFLSS